VIDLTEPEPLVRAVAEGGQQHVVTELPQVIRLGSLRSGPASFPAPIAQEGTAGRDEHSRFRRAGDITYVTVDSEGYPERRRA
jgi:hypothetical protein